MEINLKKGKTGNTKETFNKEYQMAEKSLRNRKLEKMN